MKRIKRPINEKSIVIYLNGGYSHLFRNYVSLLDVRGVCERKDCSDPFDHYTFDGQFFFKKNNGI